MGVWSRTVVALKSLLRTATATSDAIDLTGFTEATAIFAVLNSGKASVGTTPTLNVKVQTCATVDGSYVDVTGYAFPQITDAADFCGELPIVPAACSRFIKIVATIGGTDTPTFTFGCSVIGFRNP